MQVKYILIALMLVAAVAAVAGCTGTSTPSATPTATPSAAPASQYPMIITDNFGRNLTIQSAPVRIVSLSPANTEMLFDLGAGDRIVGTDDYSDYPAAAANITHVSGFSGINYEEIAAISPDVIVCEDTITEDQVNKLQDMGYTTITLDNANMTMIEQNIMLLGKLTGTEANATAIDANITARLDPISAKTAALNDSQRPSVLMFAGYVPDSDIYVFGNGTYGDDLIKLAGGTNAASAINQYGVMSSEAIVKADPDYIIVPVDNSSMGMFSDFEALKNGSVAWMTGMKAYKEGHIIMVDGNLMERPGPRLPDAGLAIAEAIHPELFS